MCNGFNSVSQFFFQDDHSVRCHVSNLIIHLDFMFKHEHPSKRQCIQHYNFCWFNIFKMILQASSFNMFVHVVVMYSILMIIQMSLVNMVIKLHICYDFSMVIHMIVVSPTRSSDCWLCIQYGHPARNMIFQRVACIITLFVIY